VNHTQFAFESKYWPQVMEFSIILTQVGSTHDLRFTSSYLSADISTKG
jgi:hypothetical protein